MGLLDHKEALWSTSVLIPLWPSSPPRWTVKSVSCSVMCDSLQHPWTVAHQAPLSMEFSRQEYWSGLPFPSPGIFPKPGIKPRSPALQADSLPSEPPGKLSQIPMVKIIPFMSYKSCFSSITLNTLDFLSDRRTERSDLYQCNISEHKLWILTNLGFNLGTYIAILVLWGLPIRQGYLFLPPWLDVGITIRSLGEEEIRGGGQKARAKPERLQL